MSGQPRTHFEDEALKELAASIKERGVLMPILARRSGKDFAIIAGERRWRAAQRAGLQQVPVILEEADDAEAFELALIENIQREDLSPIEEAEGYERLMQTGAYTQAELATKVGKRRSTVANAMRLLKLPEAVRAEVNQGRLSMGHARALLAVSDEALLEQLSRKVIAEGLSVRQTEALLKKKRPKVTPAKTESANTRELTRRLEQLFGVRVQIEHKGPGGKVQLSYGSLDELDALLERVKAR